MDRDDSRRNEEVNFSINFEVFPPPLNGDLDQFRFSKNRIPVHNKSI